MSTKKIKFELEITGFKLKMEGSTESTASITSQVSDAIRGLITPPAISETPTTKPVITEDVDSTVVSSLNGSNRKRNIKRAPRQNNQNGEANVAIDFRHEPEKYGNPLQEWTTATKSLWLLYVVKNIANKDGLTTLQITDTFNKHFKQSKMIIRNNVSRDLGKLKAKSNSAVGEETTKNPSEWYLTEVGQKQVEKLIEEQKAKSNGVN